jgi:hypothetical protein
MSRLKWDWRMTGKERAVHLAELYRVSGKKEEDAAVLLDGKIPTTAV